MRTDAKQTPPATVAPRLEVTISKTSQKRSTSMRLVKSLLAASLLAIAAPSFANIVLNFDNLADFTQIKNSYAAKGFSFSDAAFAMAPGNAGGSGNYNNPPSGPNAVSGVDLTGDGTATFIINVAEGFGSWFRFAYTGMSSATGSVAVYSGLNGADKDGGKSALLEVSLTGTVNGSNGCPGTLCVWNTNAASTFSGTAKSVVFTLKDLGYFFDNLDFGDIPTQPGHLPEPAGLALALSGLGLAAAARRRRQG
ncbi:hypothetical protein RQP53_13295 [Paucibacter sp. APW11]|uniref:PEP-CTERM protein-sorting domain-containing protein n=1 Tax=Roseateles aquae TaxID=3077235 RepID=A0ABU3PCG9_9BURK|nr:hypothetical protein [Paucibacter sp. APW11]